MSNGMPDKMSEYMSGRMPGKTSKYKSARMSNIMPNEI
jgi:hypothetical protein